MGVLTQSLSSHDVVVGGGGVPMSDINGKNIVRQLRRDMTRRLFVVCLFVFLLGAGRECGKLESFMSVVPSQAQGPEMTYPASTSASYVDVLRSTLD